MKKNSTAIERLIKRDGLRIADGERTLGIGAAPVAVVALLASLSGWGLLAALDRESSNLKVVFRGKQELLCAKLEEKLADGTIDAILTKFKSEAEAE